MTRLIDADALHRKVKMETNPYGKPTIDYDSGVKVLEWIDKAPTLDAVPVVQCKDCKHLYDAMDDYCCMSHRGLVKICENSFCSYGERKDGAD